MRFPQAFVEQIEGLLPIAERDAFFASYAQAPCLGLRVNTLKVSVDDFKEQVPFQLQPVSWAPTGFYYDSRVRPAKHPYYHAGLYYLQEPSAMAPAALLTPQPGEMVLDLCAAPGGKATQLAAALGGSGLLVANDPGRDRVKALVRNLELAGVINAVITNDMPDRLAKYFPRFFDRVLIDAPCSGEGMFRKDAGVLAAWTEDAGHSFSRLQIQILRAGAAMVRPGGRLLYSTCTFNRRENEEIIRRFLGEQSDFSLCEIPKIHGFAPGVGDDMGGVARLWPHRVRGEGHFLALMERSGGASCRNVEMVSVPKLQLDTFHTFTGKYLRETVLKGIFINYGGHLYLQPAGVPALQGLKVVRPGLYLGELKKNRFEPSHALALALRPKQLLNYINFPVSAPEVVRYLKAETLHVDGEKEGWTLFCADNFPLGWAKHTAEGLKNYYPIAWRLVD